MIDEMFTKEDIILHFSLNRYTKDLWCEHCEDWVPLEQWKMGDFSGCDTCDSHLGIQHWNADDNCCWTYDAVWNHGKIKVRLMEPLEPEIEINLVDKHQGPSNTGFIAFAEREKKLRDNEVRMITNLVERERDYNARSWIKDGLRLARYWTTRQVQKAKERYQDR